MRFARPTPETGKFLKRSDGHLDRKLGRLVTIENTWRVQSVAHYLPRGSIAENWRKNCAPLLEKKEFLVIVAVLIERYFPLDRFNFQRELV